MSNFTRRQFITIAAAAASIVSIPFIVRGVSKKVLVIGGGSGGAIAAKYIRMADQNIDVTLIEQNKYYHTCFMSNEVLSGKRTIDSIKFSYDGLNKYGINIIHSRAINIDPVAKKVRLAGGEEVAFDKLIVSPGIEFNWDAIEGYNAEIAEKIPHAWKAGSQTVTLRKQLEQMKDGGSVIISIPAKPFRCPPGPYERASQIANYFKYHKPKSKVLLFDANQAFSKQALFTQGWEQMYGYGTDNSIIEWIPSNSEGKVTGVNVKANAVIAGEFEDEYPADVLNIIPPQTAGKIAIDSGLTNDSGWCPVNQKTFESSLHKDIHVIGDACIASPMPKSAYAANTQAKVCAEAIVSELQEREMATPSYLNTCYSVVGDDFAISVAAIYRLENGKIVSIKGSGGLSALNASAATRKYEVAYAHSWFNNITYDMFN
ncbi:NAD(P)/FAD-dependent oxidoreductase [Candidatus Marithrix sp. Canyon 246]|uniref:NAD(P)/FAD-dependent oxidoreductase n=2 Tax=Candidatus Marithrix sp. Canyon 246 TaxID=1827136 RepID=UPI00084A2087|nr:NAD(P)/FAD-dependent oxidoreductase [Candidatus Marithrix sp. Canyon 246]